jgi:hypothetical protein
MKQPRNNRSLSTVTRQAVRTAGWHLAAWRKSFTHRKDFATIDAYCMFVGYPHSGHSLVGSLLDAHRHAVIAHELDVLRHVRGRLGRNQVFSLVVESHRSATGRWGGGYDLTVPNQWQGKWDELRVIGDKKGGASTLLLDRSPELLDRLRKTVEVPLRIIHVTRNPYDNIASYRMRINARPRRSPMTLPEAVDDFLARYEAVSRLQSRVDSREILNLRLEDLTADTTENLRVLCGFVGLDSPEDYLDACSKIVFPSARRTRDQEDWEPALIKEVEERMAPLEFLDGYSFNE